MPALALRPTKPKADDPVILAAFTGSMRRGLPISISATNAGIGEQTARDWLNQGDAELEANAENADWVPSPQAGFAWAFKEALAHFVTENVSVVEADRSDAAKGKRWLPAMTLLARRMPEEYGERRQIDVTSTQLTISVTMPPEALPALRRTLDNTKLLAAPSGDSQEPE